MLFNKQKCKLVVEYSARVTYITSPVIASVGEDVVLECEAEGMPMKAGMIKWLRGQEEMKSLGQDQRLIRMNASRVNSGAYTCLVDNGIGQPNQTTAYLLVRRAPEVVKRPGFNRAAGPIGGKATLRCRATAVPNAGFTWGIEGEGHMLHHNTTKYRFFDTQLDHTTFQSTFTILSLEERDYTRRYRCRVSVEKNCLTHNGSSTASSSGRTIQIYGAMSALQQQQQQPRPGSTPTTNRSELMVTMQGGNGGENGMVMDDNQSTRTIIEVSPYGHFNGGNAMMGNDFFYNANCIAEFETIEPTTDYYAKIQKGANHSNGMGMNNNYNGNANIMNYSMGPGIDANLSYQVVPNPEPPYGQPNGSGMVLYSSEQLNPMEMASTGIPPSPYMETRSACFVPSPAATAQMSSGYVVESGSLQRAPKMLTTFQNGENGIGASGISIRDTYQGDLV